MIIWIILTLLEKILILTLSRMTLSKVSFLDILRKDYFDHFDTFKNDAFQNDTFESV